MLEGVRSFVRGFGHAGRGVAALYRAERNLRVHFLAAYAAVSVAFNEPLAPSARALIVLVSGATIATELLNSALERTLDRQSMTRDRLAREAKDAAAGAVLCLSTCAVVMAALILLPHLGAFWRKARHASLVVQVVWCFGLALFGTAVLLPRAKGGQVHRS